jgi:hypothetical protein
MHRETQPLLTDLEGIAILQAVRFAQAKIHAQRAAQVFDVDSVAKLRETHVLSSYLRVIGQRYLPRLARNHAGMIKWILLSQTAVGADPRQ